MGIFCKKKQDQEPVGGNQSRDWLRNFMWETETEMLDGIPENITSVDYSLAALHAMMKPRLEIIIALLLDLRDKERES